MCKLPQGGPQCGASQLELVVSIVLFAVFMIVFAERSFYYQEYGEKVAVLSGLKAGERVVTQGAYQIRLQELRPADAGVHSHET